MWLDFAHHLKKQRDHNANDIRQLVNAGAGRGGVRVATTKTGFGPAPNLFSNPVLRAILQT